MCRNDLFLFQESHSGPVLGKNIKNWEALTLFLMKRELIYDDHTACLFTKVKSNAGQDS